MTKASGESIIIERVFENRFSYVSELRKLGAQIEYINIPIKNPREYFSLILTQARIISKRYE